MLSPQWWTLQTAPLFDFQTSVYRWDANGQRPGKSISIYGPVRPFEILCPEDIESPVMVISGTTQHFPGTPRSHPQLPHQNMLPNH